MVAKGPTLASWGRSTAAQHGLAVQDPRAGCSDMAWQARARQASTRAAMAAAQIKVSCGREMHLRSHGYATWKNGHMHIGRHVFRPQYDIIKEPTSHVVYGICQFGKIRKTQKFRSCGLLAREKRKKKQQWLLALLATALEWLSAPSSWTLGAFARAVVKEPVVKVDNKNTKKRELMHGSTFFCACALSHTSALMSTHTRTRAHQISIRRHRA